MNTLITRLQHFNQGRDPQLVQQKYLAMQADAFAFFRGTCHLFYEDWPSHSALDQAPATWICGDLHLQNLGCYRADNHEVYFNSNDFDESALAPCTWDLARLLTSVHLAAEVFGLDKAHVDPLCLHVLDVYTKTLNKGEVHTLEEDTVGSVVRDLLFQVKNRHRKAFLDAHTESIGDTRKLRIDGVHLMPVTETERTAVLSTLTQWAATQVEPQRFSVLDMAHRKAGIGSLGVDRYALLVEWKDAPDQQHLLDFKEQTTSSLQPFLKLPQPAWHSQAERVVTVQHWVQEHLPTLLAALDCQGKSYRLRNLQPIEDKIHLEHMGNKVEQWGPVLTTIAKVIAWNHLHCASQQGAATKNEFLAFAKKAQWWDVLLSYAAYYTTQVEADFHLFCAACELGALAG